MFNDSNKLRKTLYGGLAQGGELLSLWLIWLSLQLMMLVANIASTQSTD